MDKKPTNNMKVWRTFIIWTVVFLGVYLLLRVPQTEKSKIITYTEFQKYADTGNLKTAKFNGREVSGEIEGVGKYKVYLPFEDPKLPKELAKKSVDVSSKSNINVWGIVIQYLPIIFFILLFLFFIKQMQYGPNKAFQFGQSRAKMAEPTDKKVTFKDVAGIEEAKEDLKEVVEFLKKPSKFYRLGAKIPKGVLLVGPPGTGKTLLAKAVAGEAGVPFFSISGSDFVEMFVGVGASRVRDLFDRAKKNRPCILFIDEIDAVGRHRGAGIGGGHDEREQTLNALLVEMDGFEPNAGIIVLAATNRPDILDRALLRPGRFDREIVLDVPDIRGREGILKVHIKKVILNKDVDLSVIAKTTPGFTGADLANLVNEASLLAARRGAKSVGMKDFEEAKDKILMGAEKKSMIISEDEKKQIAYHEAGHTLVSKFMPHTDPIHKVTIVPRGRALGVTQQLPIDDRRIYSKDYIYSQLVVLLGGRASEVEFLNTLTTGAADDIYKATALARKMVCEWGMSERIGPLTVGKRGDEVFLGKDFATIKNFSEATAKIIDEEIRKFVEDAQEKAMDIIKKHKDLLQKIAEGLLKKEVLTGKEVDAIIKGNGKTKNKRTYKKTN